MRKIHYFVILPLWSIIPGIVGFLSGFLGPMVLNPSANQGPLLGLFITGPLCFILGGVLGVIFSKKEIGLVQHLLGILTMAMLSSTIILVSITFLINDEYEGTIVDSIVLECQKPDLLAQNKIKIWEDYVKRISNARNVSDFNKEVHNMLSKNEGVVLKVSEIRTKKIYKSMKPWSRGKLKSDDWKQENKPTMYFAEYSGKDCNNYKVGDNKVLFSETVYSNVFPPDKLVNFLQLRKLSEINDKYKQFIVN